MTIIVRAEFDVRLERVDDFRAVALALSEAASSETDTLRYSWFADVDPTKFVVIEEYTDEKAALAHNERCAYLIQRAGELAEMTAVQLHGDLGPELAAWAGQHPQARTHPALAPEL